MAIPAIPAQGQPWLTYAQGLDDEIRTGRLSDTALRAAYAAHGEATQMLGAALPNLFTAIRSYNDQTTATLLVIGGGSSVGVGATLPDPTTQAPSARFFTRLGQTINKLGNLHLALTNGSVNGSIITDFVNTDYAAAKTTAGGTPTVALLAFGMNDAMPAQYHAGQTYSGTYAAMKSAIQQVLNDGGDPIVVTTPHPHSTRTPWTAAVTSTYPSATPIPALTQAASVVTADWLANGQPVAASYRHLRVNQSMRRAALELGVPVIDAERYWFQALADYGEDALFSTGEYAHPNLLGHQRSYWLAIDDFMTGLQRATVMASTPPVVREVFTVKGANSTRANTTTLSSDSDLTFTVGAGQTWRIEADIYYAAPTAADLRVGLSLPSGSSGRISATGPGIGATSHLDSTATSYSAALPDSYGCPVGGNTADARALVTALVQTGSAGSISVQFCQDTASASATIIYLNSNMRATRLA